MQTKNAVPPFSAINGINVAEAFSPQGARYIILCDALPSTLPSSQSQEDIIALIQTEVDERLHPFPEGTLNETILINALEKANRKLIENAPGAIASALIAAPIGKEGTEFLLAGIGDYRLYGITLEKVELAFCDPYNMDVGAELSPDDRLGALHNALGQNIDIDVHCRRISRTAYQALLALSYGAYVQIQEQEWPQLALPATSLENRLGTLLKDSSAQGHRAGAWVVTTKPNHQQDTLASSFIGNTHMVPPEKRKSKKYAALTLSIVTCLVVVGLGFKMMNQSPSPQKSSGTLALNSEYINEEALSDEINALTASLNQNGNISESLLVALREQNRLQSEKIERLAKKLQERDDAISSLQSTIAIGEQKCAELEQSLSEMRASSTEKEGSQQQQEVHQHQLSELNAELASYKSRIEIQESELGGLKALKVRHGELEAFLESLKSEHAIQSQILAAEQERLEILNKVSERESEQFREEREQLRQQIAQALAARDEQEQALLALQKEQEENRQLWSEREAAHEELKATYEALLAQQRLIENENAQLIVNAEKERKEQQALLAASDQALATLNAEVNSLSQTLKERDTQLAAFKENSAQMELMTQAHDQEFGSLVARFQELQKEFSIKEEAFNVLQGQHEQLTAIYDKQKKERVSLDSDIKDLLTYTKEKEYLLNSSEKKIAELQHACELAQQEASKEHLMRLEREKQFQHLAASIDEQKRALLELERSRNALVSEVKLLKQSQSSVLPRTATPTSAVKGTRYHTVTQGDTLSTISLAYYGTSKRWHEIYEANKESIPNKNQIKVGTTLMIPAMSE